MFNWIFWLFEKDQFQVIDVTEDTKAILRGMRELKQKGKNITATQLIDVFKGAHTNKIRDSGETIEERKVNNFVFVLA